MGRRALTFVGLYAAFSLVLGAGLLLQVFPWHPSTVFGWVALFAAALPITAAGEWLGSVLFENRVARSLGSRNDPNGLSWARVAYGVAAAVGVVLIGVFVVGYVTVQSFSGCDIHQEAVSVSPDGKWQARSNMEGCHGLLLTTWFDNKVTLSKINKTATEKPQIVFESDASDPIVLTWTGPRQLNIDVGNISQISTSARSHRELTITYTVPEWVMTNLNS